MMASVGLLGQHFIKFPGFEQAPGGFAAFVTGEGFLGSVLLFAACGFLELAWREREGREPGNFGDPWGVRMYNEEMRLKEISNGRFAMICVLGIFAAELASGKDAIQQFGLSAYGDAVGANKHASSAFAGISARRALLSSVTSRKAVALEEAEEAEYEPPPFEPAQQV